MSGGNVYLISPSHRLSNALRRPFELRSELMVDESDLVLLGRVNELEKIGISFSGPCGGFLKNN